PGPHRRPPTRLSLPLRVLDRAPRNIRRAGRGHARRRLARGDDAAARRPVLRRRPARRLHAAGPGHPRATRRDGHVLPHRRAGTAAGRTRAAHQGGGPRGREPLLHGRHGPHPLRRRIPRIPREYGTGDRPRGTGQALSTARRPGVAAPAPPRARARLYLRARIRVSSRSGPSAGLVHPVADREEPSPGDDRDPPRRDRRREPWRRGPAPHPRRRAGEEPALRVHRRADGVVSDRGRPGIVTRRRIVAVVLLLVPSVAPACLQGYRFHTVARYRAPAGRYEVRIRAEGTVPAGADLSDVAHGVVEIT